MRSAATRARQRGRGRGARRCPSGRGCRPRVRPHIVTRGCPAPARASRGAQDTTDGLRACAVDEGRSSKRDGAWRATRCPRSGHRRSPGRERQRGARRVGSRLGAGFTDKAYEEQAPRSSSRPRTYTAPRPRVQSTAALAEELAALHEGTVLVALSSRSWNKGSRAARRTQGHDVLDERDPTITRARPMDVLSSPSTVAGYKAVVVAAATLGKFFPMLRPQPERSRRPRCSCSARASQDSRRSRPPAGSVPSSPLRRPRGGEGASREPRRDVPRAGCRRRRGNGRIRGRALRGPARARAGAHRSPRRRIRCRRLHSPDPGPPGAGARHRGGGPWHGPGSVIIDLAAEIGGNCELTGPGKTIAVDGVTIVGEVNMPSTNALHASQCTPGTYGFLGFCSRTASSCWTSRTRSFARPALRTRDAS